MLLEALVTCIAFECTAEVAYSVFASVALCIGGLCFFAIPDYIHYSGSDYIVYVVRIIGLRFVLCINL